MTSDWRTSLRVDPIPVLLAGENPALSFYIHRDLLGMENGSEKILQHLPEVERLVDLQQENGSWRYPGGKAHPDPNANYSLLETYRNLRLLVEMYGMRREHGCVEKAAEFIFSCQTPEGDIRGILGNQYMPYYHGAIWELLIKAGYQNDQRILKGLDWLLFMRQEDGGWVVPAQQVKASEKTPAFWNAPAMPPDRNRPHSHLATGMVLRAFAAHPEYRRNSDVIRAGERLKERLFKADMYNDRKTPEYWLKFQYPAWWPNLVNALDSLQLLGFSKKDPDISPGIQWFLGNQSPDGLWETGYGKGKKANINRQWVGLAVCRMLKHFHMVD